MSCIIIWMSILYLTHLLNGLLMIAMPVVLGILLTRKFHLGWRLWWIGAATFVLSQVVHIPFNLLILNPFLREKFPAGQGDKSALLITAIALGLSAGVFEEVGRYLAYLFWAKDARSWRKGVLMGAGHGGIEAVILGGLVLLAYTQLVALRDSDLISRVPQEQLALLQNQIQIYWSLPWYDTLLGALERFFTLFFHISASVIVLQVFLRRQIRWLWVAILWHAILDAAAVYAISTWGTYAAEALIGVSALLSLGIILALRSPEPLEEEPASPAPLPELVNPQHLEQVEITPAKLDDTRYNPS